MKSFDWFVCWTPIARIPYNCVDVGDNLFQIAPHTFIYSQEYNSKFEVDEDSPYATLLLMAPTTGAALRAVKGNVELDPNELLDTEIVPDIGVHNLTFGNIDQLSGSSKRASYSGKTGKFQQVVIDWNNYSFCFRENNPKSHNKPYAIIFGG